MAIMLQVNTKRLKKAAEQMQQQLMRKEELMEHLDQLFLEFGKRWSLKQRSDWADVLDRVHREVYYEKKMIYGLERIAKNYEATEKSLLRIQEEGIPENNKTDFKKLDLSELNELLRAWKLI